ncbi:hypothetical protein Q3G72_013425 [Acer saccharum]|nr:hypothetical protein Q3G72_013425 [Acer saccharum]
MTGNMKLVLLMLEKNEELAMIRNRSGKLPVQMAALLGHKEMVNKLYCTTKNKLTQEDLFELLILLIGNDLCDFALSMVKEFPELAIVRAKPKEEYFDYTERVGQTALHALARKPMMNSKQGILKRFYNRRTNKRMHPEALELVKHLWGNVMDKLDYYQIEYLVNKPFRLVSHAAKEGNIEFLLILFRKHPALIRKVNEDGYTIFHTAVSYRHKNILKLIYEIPSMKDVIFAMEVGNERNNILHLAAILPPDQNQYKVGAAFKMRQELAWFEAVRKHMPPFYAEARNRNGKTARTLFSENHESLSKDGEDWMRRTAKSCMLAATIILTVTFAAAITVPGGLKEDTGIPNFLKTLPFMFFAITNTISVASSSCSVLIFLSHK